MNLQSIKLTIKSDFLGYFFLHKYQIGWISSNNELKIVKLLKVFVAYHITCHACCFFQRNRSVMILLGSAGTERIAQFKDFVTHIKDTYFYLSIFSLDQSPVHGFKIAQCNDSRYKENYLFFVVNPLNHGGGALYAPPPPFLTPVTKNYHEAPIPENS